MASLCSILPHTLTVRCAGNFRSAAPNKVHVCKVEPSGVAGRRKLLFLLSATTVLKTVELSSKAEDIPLFGLRKKLKKVEEEAEEIVREGFEAADKGIEAAEKGIVSAERELGTAGKGIEAAEEQIASSVSFGGLAQAGVVAGAELVGVLVATSIVNEVS